MTVTLPTNQDLDPVRLRRAYGVFPTGVVALAAEVDLPAGAAPRWTDGDAPAGDDVEYRLWGDGCVEPGCPQTCFSAVAVDAAGRVYVADRENSRIQIFDSEGVFIGSWDWVNRPDDLFIDEDQNLYIAELGWSTPAISQPHFRFMQQPPVGHDPIARVTVCDLDGRIIARVGGPNPVLPGNFIAPHGLCVDSRGDLYVGEVVKKSGAMAHFAPLTCHAFQKFKRAG